MQLKYEDKWLELNRSETPLVSEVEPDEITAKACLVFDYLENSKSVFFPWIKPDLPTNYKIGLIVGSSGSGKSQMLQQFGVTHENKWTQNKSVISHFDNVEDATNKFYAVGLSSVPTWVKPYQVLSNGEKFRVDLAKSLQSNAVIDEYTSVVDRNVARAASVALSRYVKNNNINNIVISTCHRDIIEWLEPDWVIDTDTGQLLDGFFLLDPKSKLNYIKQHMKLGECLKTIII
jgi:ABC-type lipoprotein export system ATPase subunit